MDRESCKYGYYCCGAVLGDGQDFSQERDDSKPASPGKFVISRPLPPMVHEKAGVVECHHRSFCSQECAERAMGVFV